MAAKKYVVLWPLVLVKFGGQSGEQQTVSYLRQGNPVPEGYDQADVDRLVEDGALAEVTGDPAVKAALVQPPLVSPQPGKDPATPKSVK